MNAYIIQKRNDALGVNNGIGGTPDLSITTRGSDWLFTVCAVMAASTLVFMGLAFTKPRSHRLFHYLTASITLVAAIAYYSMGANLGQTPIQVEFMRASKTMGTREIFYVRYIDWAVTTPLLLLDLLLTAGLPWPTILTTILADEIMIVTGLVGALTQSRYKWGYYVFGNLAFFYVIYTLAFVGRKHAHALGSGVYKAYLYCGVLTSVIWFLYPIAWGVAEGGNVIHPDSEAVFYGILDLIAKPVFGALLIFGHRNIKLRDLGLHIHDYEEVHERTNGHHPTAEKGHNGTGATTDTATTGHNNGVTTGHTTEGTTTTV